MKSSIRTKRKKRGRPATGQDPVSAIRLSVELAQAIDSWAARNKAASRSEAIRQLVEMGLAGVQPAGRRSAKTAARASDMAGRQIDKIGDLSASAEERQDRKRRLLNGPREFRDMRGDQPKPKPKN
jgi:Arc/MetJ-type ribon-helix-helix transcriptional regulator